MGDYFVEYQSYGPNFREAITLRDFCQLKGKGKRARQRKLHVQYRFAAQHGEIIAPNF